MAEIGSTDGGVQSLERAFALLERMADAGGEEQLADRRRVGVIIGRGGYLTPGMARLDQRVRTAHQLVASLRDRRSRMLRWWTGALALAHATPLTLWLTGPSEAPSMFTAVSMPPTRSRDMKAMSSS